VLAGVATAVPERRDGIVESIRALGTARSGAVKARTAAINQFKGLLVTGPASLREALGGRSTPALVVACARLRPDQTALADPARGARPSWRWSPSASSSWFGPVTIAGSDRAGPRLYLESLGGLQLAHRGFAHLAALADLPTWPDGGRGTT
jgi:hypothetical protein